MEYRYNGILFGNIKEWIINNTYYSMAETQKPAEWNRLDTKDHKLYDSIYMACPKNADTEKMIMWLPRAGDRRGWL